MTIVFFLKLVEKCRKLFLLLDILKIGGANLSIVFWNLNISTIYFYNDPVSIKVIYEIRTWYCQIDVPYNQIITYVLKFGIQKSKVHPICERYDNLFSPKVTLKYSLG